MFKSQFTGYSINLLWNNLFLTQARDFCSHFGNFGSFGLHALSTKCSEAVQSWWPPIAGEPKKFPRENSGAKVQAWRRMPRPGSDEYLRVFRLLPVPDPKMSLTDQVGRMIQIESGNVARWAKNAMVLKFKRIRRRSRRRGTWVWPGMEEE